MRKMSVNVIHAFTLFLTRFIPAQWCNIFFYTNTSMFIDIFKNIIALSLTKRPNKLERLFLPSLSNLVYYFWVRPYATWVEHLSCVPLLGGLLALPTNNRLSWKDLFQTLLKNRHPRKPKTVIFIHMCLIYSTSLNSLLYRWLWIQPRP